MYKKLLVTTALLIIGIFSFTMCFANNGLQDAANGVQDAVGGAENAVEGAVHDISNTSKNVTQSIENDAHEATHNAGHTVAEDNNHGTYHATRTSTNHEYQNTFMGMGATAWTWLILGIAAIAIVAMVWFYSMQVRTSDYED